MTSSNHWMVVPFGNASVPAQKELLFKFSGIYIADNPIRGIGNDWERLTTNFWIPVKDACGYAKELTGLDTSYPDRKFVIYPKTYSVNISLAAFSDNNAGNFGVGIDDFGIILEDDQKFTGGLTANAAVKGADSYIFRLNYQAEIFGTIDYVPTNSL